MPGCRQVVQVRRKALMTMTVAAWRELVPFVQRLASDDPNPNGRRDAKETFTSLALDTETH